MTHLLSTAVNRQSSNNFVFQAQEFFEVRHRFNYADGVNASKYVIFPVDTRRDFILQQEKMIMVLS